MGLPDSLTSKATMPGGTGYDHKSMDFEYCPACAGELDTGYECLRCGRDWRPWATPYLNVTESEGEQ